MSINKTDKSKRLERLAHDGRLAELEASLAAAQAAVEEEDEMIGDPYNLAELEYPEEYDDEDDTDEEALIEIPLLQKLRAQGYNDLELFHLLSLHSRACRN